jgi:4-hydroxy-3-polyprenylbenzoate decarboxylase
MRKVVVGITGASGVVYGVRLINTLAELGNEVNLVVSNSGKDVLENEMDVEYQKNPILFRDSMLRLLCHRENIRYYEIDDMKAPIASGSYRTEGMVIIPCTMATAASIAAGTSRNLIERAADVALKEGRQLVIVPREAPLSTIHLKNLLSLSQCGVKIMPAMPGFYNKPSSVDDLIDFVVGKTLDLMGIDNDIYKRWAE